MTILGFQVLDRRSRQSKEPVYPCLSLAYLHTLPQCASGGFPASHPFLFGGFDNMLGVGVHVPLESSMLVDPRQAERKRKEEVLLLRLRGFGGGT